MLSRLPECWYMHGKVRVVYAQVALVYGMLVFGSEGGTVGRVITVKVEFALLAGELRWFANELAGPRPYFPSSHYID